MMRLKFSFIVLLAVILVSCRPGQFGSLGDTGTESPAVIPTTLPQPAGRVPQVTVLSPLQIDSANGRLYAEAQVNGEPKIAVMRAADGALLAAWDGTGRLALDAARGRLAIDSGTQGITLLDAANGQAQGTVSLPSQADPPPPQIDAKSGLLYAFRESTIHVIDPAIRTVIRTVPVEVENVVCDSPAGDAPIHRTAVDPSGGRLYLSFISRVCTPWASITLLAYDTERRREIGRAEFDINTQFLAYNKNAYGASVNRLGPMMAWAWDGSTLWHQQSSDGIGPPAGMAADSGRKLIYEALGETLRAVEPRERRVMAEVAVPLPSGSTLAGFDAATDNLYFVTPTGRLNSWAAANLPNPVSPPVAAPSPLPATAVRLLAPAPNWSTNRTLAAIFDDPACGGGGQLFLLMNPAAGWVPGVFEESPCPDVTTIAFSPGFQQDSLIFAATRRPSTVLRSLDMGRSWTAAQSPFPDGVHFKTLLPSPNYATDQTIFALTNAGLLYRSRDGGRNWQLLDQRLDHVALAGPTSPAVHLYGVYGGRVLHSTDGGEKWRETGLTPGREELALFAAAPSGGDFPVFFAFTAGGQFTRSIDAGAGWNPVIETSPGAAQLAIAADMPDAQRPVFLLHEGSVTASYDGMAAVWAATAADEAARLSPTALAVSPQFLAAPYLLVGTADGQIIYLRAAAPTP